MSDQKDANGSFWQPDSLLSQPTPPLLPEAALAPQQASAPSTLPQATRLPQQAPQLTPAAPEDPPKSRKATRRIATIVLCALFVLGALSLVTAVVLYKNQQQQVAQAKKIAAQQAAAAKAAQQAKIQKEIDQVRQDIGAFTAGNSITIPARATGEAASFETFLNRQLQGAWNGVSTHVSNLVTYSNRFADPQEFITADSDLSSLRQGLADIQKEAADFHDKRISLLSAKAISDELSKSSYHFSASQKAQLKELGLACFNKFNADLVAPEADEASLWQMTGSYIDFLASTKGGWTAKEGGLYFTSRANMDTANRLNSTRHNQANTTVDAFRKLLLQGVPSV